MDVDVPVPFAVCLVFHWYWFLEVDHESGVRFLSRLVYMKIGKHDR